MIVPTKFNIDTGMNINHIPLMNFKQADTNSHKLVITILNNGVSIDLSNHTAKIYFKKPDGTEIFQSCSIDDASNGVISCTLTSNTLAAVGTINAEITVYGTDGSIYASITFPITVIGVLRNDASLQSTSEYSGLSDAIAQITNFSAQLTGIENYLNYMPINGGSFDGNDASNVNIDGGTY